MRVTVFDYGAGNLHSLVKALPREGCEITVEADPRRLRFAGILVLPGVGAFAQAAERLAPARAGLRDALRDGLPCVGICLGMQLLFQDSSEGRGHGIGLLEGPVRRLDALTLPHIGWNQIVGDLNPLPESARLGLAYFANSYACRPENPGCVSAWTTHESDRFPAIVRTARTVGVQFHPEKSSRAGVRFLRETLGMLIEQAR